MFVKLDCNMLTSTTWFDKPARDVFITALLMARPHEAREPMEQLEVRRLEETGWILKPGWYGLVESAGMGIVKQALVDEEEGMAALERLGAPDPESRSQEHDGRRLIRVDGGFVILNFQKYRDKDHTAAERMRRFRERQAELRRNNKHVTSRNGVTGRNVTQAEAEAEAEAGNPPIVPPGGQTETAQVGDHPKLPHTDTHGAVAGNQGPTGDRPKQTRRRKEESDAERALCTEVLAHLREAVAKLDPRPPAPRDCAGNRKMILRPVRATGATLEDWKHVIDRQLRDVQRSGEHRWLQLKTMSVPDNFLSILERPESRPKPRQASFIPDGTEQFGVGRKEVPR